MVLVLVLVPEGDDRVRQSSHRLVVPAGPRTPKSNSCTTAAAADPVPTLPGSWQYWLCASCPELQPDGSKQRQ